jgi:hypothetical protein
LAPQTTGEARVDERFTAHPSEEVRVPRACEAPLDEEQFLRELRAMIIEDAGAISHALTCRRCGTRDVALHCLGLARWTQADFYAELGVFGE